MNNELRMNGERNSGKGTMNKKNETNKSTIQNLILNQTKNLKYLK